MEPQGQPIEEVYALMGEQFAECCRLLDQMPNGEGSLYRVNMSVNGSGKLDLYEWIAFLALHAHRHVAQMEENVQESALT